MRFPASPIHTQINDTFSQNVCGLDVTGADVGVDNFTPIFDSSGNLVSFRDTIQIKTTFTNPANGKKLVLQLLPQTRLAPLSAISPVSSRSPPTTRASLRRIFVPGGPVITMDVGFITFVTVMDFTTNPAVVVSQAITINHGPHPDATGSIFCGVFTQTLA